MRKPSLLNSATDHSDSCERKLQQILIPDQQPSWGSCRGLIFLRPPIKARGVCNQGLTSAQEKTLFLPFCRWLTSNQERVSYLSVGQGNKRHPFCFPPFPVDRGDNRHLLSLAESQAKQASCLPCAQDEHTMLRSNDLICPFYNHSKT